MVHWLPAASIYFASHKYARMTNKENWTVASFGVSLPKPLLIEVDTIRGDVSRSRYIQRLLERNMNSIAQIHPKVCRPEGSVLPAAKGKGDPNPND